MGKTSGGLLLYRRRAGKWEVLLAHPGGPFWARRDEGAWSLPKGELDEGEEPLAAAVREFEEETGQAPGGPFLALGSVRQKAGKVVHGWAFEGDLDPTGFRSATFQMEWPRGSGRMAEFPEVDRVEFFRLDEARRRLNPAQTVFIDRLERALEGRGGGE